MSGTWTQLLKNWWSRWPWQFPPLKHFRQASPCLRAPDRPFTQALTESDGLTTDVPWLPFLRGFTLEKWIIVKSFFVPLKCKSFLKKPLASFIPRTVFLKDLEPTLWNEIMEDGGVPPCQSPWEGRHPRSLPGHLALSVTLLPITEARESLCLPSVWPVSKQRRPVIPTPQISEWALIFLP